MPKLKKKSGDQKRKEDRIRKRKTRAKKANRHVDPALPPPSLNMFLKKDNDQGNPQCDSNVIVQDSGRNQDIPCDYIQRGPDVHKSFCSKGNLTIRLLAHTGEKTFKCEECDKSFSQRSGLVQHSRTHTGDKPFKCEECDKSFSFRSGLVQHSRTHTGDKPFKCEECDKSFSQRSGLVQHSRTHTGDKPFKCEECDKSFSKRSGLVQHSWTHTGDKPFKCGQYGKSFCRQSSLKTHLGKHTSEKPYKCGHCSKSFVHQYSLKMHTMTHTGDNPFKCDKSFSQHSGLVHYVRTQHQGPPQCDSKVRGQDSGLNQDPPCDYIERGSHVQKLPPNLSDCFGNKQDTKSTCMVNEDEEENLLHYIKKETSDAETVSCPKEIQNDLSEEEPKSCPQYEKTMQSNEPINSTEYANQITVHVSSVVSQRDNVDSSELIKTEPCDSLNEQIKTSAFENPFKCGLCGKCFSLPSALSTHMRTHNR